MKNKTIFGVAILILSVWAAVLSAYAAQIKADLAKGKNPKMITFDGKSCTSTTTTSTTE